MVFFTIKIFMMTRKHCCVFVFPSFLTLLSRFAVGAVQKCTGQFCRQGRRRQQPRSVWKRTLDVQKSGTATVAGLLNADFTMRTNSLWSIPREMVDSPVLDTKICLTVCCVLLSGPCFCQKGWSRWSLRFLPTRYLMVAWSLSLKESTCFREQVKRNRTEKCF